MKLRLAVAVLLVAAVSCGSESAQVDAGQSDTSEASSTTGGSERSEYFSDVPVPESLAKSLAIAPGPTTASDLTFVPKQESTDDLPLVQVDPKTGGSTEAPGPDPGGWLTDVSTLASPAWLAIGATVCPERPFEGDTGPECSVNGKQAIFVRDDAGAWRESPVPATTNIYLRMLDEKVIVWDSAEGRFSTSLDDLSSTKLGPPKTSEEKSYICRPFDPEVEVSFDLSKSAAQVARPTGQEVVPLGTALNGWEGGLIPPVCYGSSTTLVVSGIEAAIPPPGVVPEAPQGGHIADSGSSPETGDAADSVVPARVVSVGSGKSVDLPFTSLSDAVATGEWVLAAGTAGGESTLWMKGPDGVIELADWSAPSSMMASSTGAISVGQDNEGAITSIKVFRPDK